jgi:hypothetical protein
LCVLEIVLVYESTFTNEPARSFGLLKTKEHVSRYLPEAATLCVPRYLLEAPVLMLMNIYLQGTTRLVQIN